MHQHQSQQANVEGAESHSGGAAPEHRRCQYLKADGKGCRDWAVRGQEFCYRHGVFLHGGRGIDVPLLEDEASIVLVLSETLRAVACGRIPVDHGRLLIDGCRLAHTLQMANASHRARRTEAREDQSTEPGGGRPEPSAAEAARSREPRSDCPEPCHRSSEPCATPAPHPLSPQGHPCIDLQDNWDKELPAAEGEMIDMLDLRCEQAQVEVLAARAAPLDERMEEESLAVGVS